MYLNYTSPLSFLKSRTFSGTSAPACFPTSSTENCFILHTSSRERGKEISSLFLSFHSMENTNWDGWVLRPPLCKDTQPNHPMSRCIPLTYISRILASSAKVHLQWSFFAAFIMYLLLVSSTPKKYRSIGYIPTQEHSFCRLSETLVSPGLCTFNAHLSAACNISLKKKKIKLQALSGT